MKRNNCVAVFFGVLIGLLISNMYIEHVINKKHEFHDITFNVKTIAWNAPTDLKEFIRK